MMAVATRADGGGACRVTDRRFGPNVRALSIPILVLCGIAAMPAAACAEPLGDYGRPQESPFVNEFLPWLKNGWGEITGTAVPAAPYTDDEHELRDRAYIILQPIELRLPSRLTLAGVDFVELWDLVFDPPGFDVQSYGDTLIERAYRSHAARYAQLIDDIRADTKLVGPFFATAQRVLDADGVRKRSFRYVSQGPDHIGMAQRRIDENRVLMSEVYRRFKERIESYRYALQTLLVLTPSPAAVNAEKALYHLEEQFRLVTAPPVVSPNVIVRK
jgi:hypothetical protein